MKKYQVEESHASVSATTKWYERKKEAERKFDSADFEIIGTFDTKEEALEFANKQDRKTRWDCYHRCWHATRIIITEIDSETEEPTYDYGETLREDYPEEIGTN